MTNQADTLILLRDEIEKMKKKVPTQEGKWLPIDDVNMGYNDSITDVLHLIDSKLKIPQDK